MVGNPAAFTVADLCSDHTTGGHRVDGFDDQSTIEYADEDEEDSFIANSSLCREHRSTIQMLNSLRREVVEMARSEDKKMAPKKSPQTVTVDLSRQTDLSSPLASPLLARTITSVSTSAVPLPGLSNNTVSRCESESDLRNPKSNDDSTFCSMDNSIENDMNNLNEVMKNLEKELQAENLDTVFEAIERIGKSEDTNASQERIRKGFGSQILDIIDFFRCLLSYSTDAKILVAAIFFCLLRKYFSLGQA